MADFVVIGMCRGDSDRRLKVVLPVPVGFGAQEKTVRWSGQVRRAWIEALQAFHSSLWRVLWLQERQV
jgi:hypothetical protein